MDHSLYHPTPHFLPFRRKRPSNTTTSNPTHSSHHSSSGASGPPTSPSAPTNPSRPPLLYNEEYYSYLDKAVKNLQEDYASGAREMANQALRYLATVIEIAAITARDGRETWEMAVMGGRALSEARPAMRFVGLGMGSVVATYISPISLLYPFFFVGKLYNPIVSPSRNPFLSPQELLLQQQQQQQQRQQRNVRNTDDASMISAAITACLLRALAAIQELWEAPAQKEMDPSGLARLASQRIEKIVRERRDAEGALGRGFAFWVKRLVGELNPPTLNTQPGTTPGPAPAPPPITIHILTLSNSSTIRTAIQALLTHAPDIHLDLTILESRPRFEGADMAARILDEVAKCKSQAKNPQSLERLRVRLVPDCAVGSVFAQRKVDVVLLGADRVTKEGDVSNKVGSLGAVVGGKVLGGGRGGGGGPGGGDGGVKVVVVSDADKIVGDGEGGFGDGGHGEVHPAGEVMGAWTQGAREVLGGMLEGGMGGGGEGVVGGKKRREEGGNREEGETGRTRGVVEVWGEWFEVVPARYVDAYVTELGIWGREEVRRAGEEVRVLEERVFGRRG
ncbi:nagb/rpia/CoA transferase-like protein [Westerdykella ornata]|uniref:Nagb/rpia/CoA transferase-like protein n=1 Tax=Westerdykella ornata TaxID=318751 RepID=A0A6A6JKA3_WESOR|nr:nagb/rpia/CoA transferase-like protein [Westerdykella ornata]KAF2276902.1 nagb/rpia/CoA transferase-like protein [Westerdykella ornata]